MNEASVLRGQVLTFSSSEYGVGIGAIGFVDRPQVREQDIVLPPGVLSRIRRHVVGIGEEASALRELGQHLKRGVLLYGPPGTGKTLSVRHLVHEAVGTTVVLLQGMSLQLIGEATALARAFAPSMVVLEDVDLVAGDRMMFGGPQPLLFEILDVLDGLADVTFVLTTNRVDVLEPALASARDAWTSPSRSRLPDAAGREALLRLHAAELGLSDDALRSAVERAIGTTASFAKELARRTVLRAAGGPVGDADLAGALDDMLGERAGITAALFGGEGGTVSRG